MISVQPQWGKLKAYGLQPIPLLTPIDALRYETKRPQTHLPGCGHAPTRVPSAQAHIVPAHETPMCVACLWKLPGAHDFARAQDALRCQRGVLRARTSFDAIRQEAEVRSLLHVIEGMTHGSMQLEALRVSQQLAESAATFFSRHGREAWLKERDAAYAQAGARREDFDDSPALLAVRAGTFAMGGHSRTDPSHTLTRWLTRASSCAVRYQQPSGTFDDATIWALDGELAQLARLVTQETRVSPVIALEAGDADVLDAAMRIAQHLGHARSPHHLTLTALQAARSCLAGVG